MLVEKIEEIKKVLKQYQKPIKYSAVIEFLEESGIDSEEELEQIFDFLQKADFVMTDKMIVPKNWFLKDIDIRIKLTPLEVNEKTLILGHRILSFVKYSFDKMPVLLDLNNKALKINKITKSYDEVEIFFSLFMPIEVPCEYQDELILLKGYDLSSILNEDESDGYIVLKPIDLEKMIFQICYEPHKKIVEKSLVMKKNDDLFFKYLFQFLEENIDSLSEVSLDNQMLSAYYKTHQSIKKQKREILFSPLGPALENYKAVIHRFPGSMLIVPFDRLEEIQENIIESYQLKSDSKELDLNQLEDYLEYLDLNISVHEIRARMIEQIQKNIYNSKSFIKVLIEGRNHVFETKKEEKDLIKLIEKEHQLLIHSEIIKNTNMVVLYQRKIILDILFNIREFIRKIDKMKVDVVEFHKNPAVMELVQLNGMLDGYLEILENPNKKDMLEFKKNQKKIEEIHLSIPKVIQQLLEDFNQ
ncbi:MAG TPA: hypothetical protein DHW82_09000 [Spirochaetia bacterium]|nr:MAG: hypothetical protein A2Y41_06240 [Spirochaetes bacterium GWB1_36_13]HCL57127.1 hypothetical protein [Spirochaetia bacterium]